MGRGFFAAIAFHDEALRLWRKKLEEEYIVIDETGDSVVLIPKTKGTNQ